MDRAAAWCGRCGALVAPGRQRGGEDLESAAAGGAEHERVGPWTPWWLVLVAAAVLVAAVVVVAPWATPSEPLLGRLEVKTGVTTSAPPPSGLRHAWTHALGQRAESGGASGWPFEVAAGGGRVLVDDWALDLDSGEVVSVASRGAGVSAERVAVDGRDLVVIDALTGAVRSRGRLPAQWPGRTWTAQRSGGVTLFPAEQGSVLISDDGTVLSEVDGDLLEFVDRAVNDPLLFPLRMWTSDTGPESRARVRLVDATSGETVVDLAEGTPRIADVVGGVAMVAETEGRVDRFGVSSAPGEVSWTVRLLDGRAADERVRLQVDADEPPRLVGTFSDGTGVIGVRAAETYRFLAVDPHGDTTELARAPRPARSGDPGRGVAGLSLDVAAVTDDVLVVNLGDGTIVGRDSTGADRWQLEDSEVAAVRAGDGYVALPSSGSAGRVRIVRARDGEVVGGLAPPREPWSSHGRPIAAIDGHLGLGGFRPAGTANDIVGTMLWLDPENGEPVPYQDVFAPFSGTDEVDGLWTFHGTVVGDDGVEPVLTRLAVRDDRVVVDAFEPGASAETFDLPMPAFEGVPQSGSETIGATGDRIFARWIELAGSGQAVTHVMNRSDGTTVTVEGLLGVEMVADVLVADETDESRLVTARVGVDASSGQRLWSAAPLEQRPGSERLRFDDQLIVDAGVATVRAMTPHEGAPVWTFDSDVALAGGVVLGSRHVAVSTTQGEVLALDRDTGTVVWQFDAAAPITALSGAGDHLLLGTHDGTVIHLDHRGQEVQRLTIGSGPVHAIATLGDTLVATLDDTITGLRPDGTGSAEPDQVELP